MKILVVEDDETVAHSLKLLLTNYNYAVDIASDGNEGLELAGAYTYDLLLLDVLLPGLDGLSLCQQLRAQGMKSPILLLTGQGGARQKAIALNAGADDYVVKPFDAEELIARVQALLRRGSSGQPVLTWGHLSIDPSSRKVAYGNQLLPLTPKEYAILELFLRSPPKALSTRDLLNHAWSSIELPGEESVRVHIKKLRQKLVAAGAPKDFVVTKHRVGYQLNPRYSNYLAEQVEQQPTPPQVAALTEVNEELRQALEELRVREEERQQQQEERALAQQKLALERQRYHDLFEFAPDAYLVTDLEGVVQEANQMAATLFQVSVHLLVGQLLTNWVVETDRPWFKQQLQQISSRQDLELMVQPQRGASVPVLVAVSPTQNLQQQSIGLHWSLRDISQRQAIDPALQASHNDLEQQLAGRTTELQLLYDQAPCGYHSLDADGIFVRVNDTELTMLGYRREELLGRSFESLLTTESRRLFRQSFPNFKQTGRVKDLEFEMVTRDGAVVPVSLSATTVCDESGRFLMSRSVVVEIRDRKQLEAERQQLETTRQSDEARYRLMFENNPNPMWFYNPETLAFLEVNQAAIDRYGYSKAEFLQKTMVDIIPTCHSDLHQVNRQITPSQPHMGTWQHQVRDGSLIDTEVTVHAIFIAGKQVNLALVKDITERQRADLTLRETQESLTIAIEAAQMGTWYLNLEQDTSPRRSLRHDQLFGYETLQAEWGQAIARQHVIPEDREIFDAAFARALETGELKFELRVQWPDGSIHWMAIYGKFYFAADGRPLYGGGVNFDITDRKQAEVEVQQAIALSAFRLKLADALRSLAAPSEIKATASRILGEYLGANRVVYFEVQETAYLVECDYVNGVSSLAGAYPINLFGEKLIRDSSSGRFIVVPNVTADRDLSLIQRAAYAAIQIGAQIGIPLTRNGKFVAGLAVHMAEPRDWTATEISIAEEVAERTWAAVERACAETALRQSEARYRTLFNLIDEGYFLAEVLFDANDQPVDLLYLEANPAAIEIVGQDFTGLRLSEINADYDPDWYETVGQVARFGQGERIERYFAPNKIWCDCYVFKIGDATSSRVAIIFQNTTERKRREANTAFLAELGEIFSQLSKPEEIMQVVGEKLGTFLNLPYCQFMAIDETKNELVYLERWNADHVPRLPDRVSLLQYISPDFCRLIRAGETIVSHNTQTSPLTRGEANAQVQAIAFIAIPLNKGGGWQYLFSLHDTSPRNWQPDEIELVREFANQVFPFLERARTHTALQTNEQLLRFALRGAKAGSWTWDIVTNQLTWSEGIYTLHGLLPNSEPPPLDVWFTQHLHPEDRERISQQVAQSLEQPQPEIQLEYRIVNGSMGTRWLLSQGHLQCDPEGNPIQMIGITLDISDRKQAELTLQKSEETIRQQFNEIEAIYQTTPIGLGVLNLELRYVKLNQHLAEINGFAVADHLGRTVYEMVPLMAGDIIAQLQQILATGKPLLNVEMSGEINTQPGVQRVWLQSFFPLRDQSGQVVGINVVVQEITHQKQAQVALQQSEQKLRAIFNSTFQMIGLLSSAGIVLDANQTALDAIAAQTTDVVGRPFWETLWWQHSPEQQQRLRSAIATAANGEFVRFETHHIWQDGTAVTLDFSISPIFDAAGKVILLVPEGRDITDRIRLETERQRAEAKIIEQATLLDIASDAIFVRDFEHHILYWNQGAERLYGWQKEEAIGQRADHLLRSSTEQLSEITEILLRQGEWRGEMQKQTRANKVVTVEARWTLVRDDGGQPRFILSVDTDITEKKQLETQFYHAQRLESLGTLASGIAHDLNNVLTPILTISQLFRLQPMYQHEPTKEMVDMIEDSAKRGANMIRQILAYTRGTGGECSIVEVAALVQEVASIAQQTFPKAIEVNLNLSEASLWNVYVDSTHLHQVLMNLCVNARDAMPNGGSLTLTVENREVDKAFAQKHLNAQAGNYIVVGVADTGSGISEAVRDRMFEPFYTTKPRGKGTGLGLSTVLGIVKSYGGFLQVVSEEGRGTQMRVYLPAIETEPTGDGAQASDWAGNWQLILIVDDDLVVQRSTQSLLENHFYMTLVANDGVEAIDLYAQHQDKIDLVLTDVMMPNLGGVPLIEQLKAINPEAKIIAMSGVVANREPILAAGAQAFLAKPYTSEAMLRQLRNLLNE